MDFCNVFLHNWKYIQNSYGFWNINKFFLIMKRIVYQIIYWEMIFQTIC